MKKKVLLVILFAISVLLVILFLVQKKKSVPLTSLSGGEAENVLEEIETRPKAGYPFTLSSGETITIYLPEGIDPPPQNVVEKMYREKK